MANPSLEDGHIAIASDLFLAMIRFGFSSLEERVLWAVMFMTYGAHKSKSEMTPSDIRILLGSTDNLKTARIEETVNSLVERNILHLQRFPNGTTVIGVQKDFDKWGPLFGKSLGEATDGSSPDKMSALYSLSNIYTNTNTIYSSDKMSAIDEKPKRKTVANTLLSYWLSQSKGNYSLGQYKAESKAANELYRLALVRFRSPLLAAQTVKDFLDDIIEQDWYTGRMIFTYMLSRFDQYLTKVPRKPKRVEEDEAIMHYRMRWSSAKKEWVRSSERLT